jgi:hypothetical protein
MNDNCFFFGVYREAGHFLWQPHWQRVRYPASQRIELFGDGHHIDGNLAPRLYHPRYGSGICWGAQGPIQRLPISYQSEECPEGQFLRHLLPNGFSAAQWWDRCQGDTRGACNSTILLEGEHTSEEMLAALELHFPRVLDNLNGKGVELVEVFL